MKNKYDILPLYSWVFLSGVPFTVPFRSLDPKKRRHRQKSAVWVSRTDGLGVWRQIIVTSPMDSLVEGGASFGGECIGGGNIGL